MSDLATLDRLPALATQINRAHDLACRSAQSAINHAMAVGEALIEAKALVAHGEWLAWLAENCDFSERTAQNYMKLASHREQVQSNPQSVADLPISAALKAIRKPTSANLPTLTPNPDPAFDAPLVPVEITPGDKAAFRHQIRTVGLNPADGLGPGGNDDEVSEIEAMQAEIDELREYAAALEKDIAELKAENKKFEDMRVQWEMGGYAKVIAGKDEQIRVLLRQVERESHEKVRNLNSMEWWKKRAIKLGYSRDVIIPLDDGPRGAA